MRKLILKLIQLFCPHKSVISLRIEVIGYGYRVGDRVYKKCSFCGRLEVIEEGIAV